jgi:hypothetical protein
MNESGNAQPQNSTLDLRLIDAEQRVNLIRISAIACFYLIHLWHVSAPGLSETMSNAIGFDADKTVSANVHLAVTVLCFGWLMQAFAVHLMIAQRRMNTWFVTVTTLGDLAWLTAILCLSSGPAGPLVAGYFLIIMLTGLRFDLRLVRITTVVAMMAYLVLLGVARWPFGIVKEIGLETVPRYHQFMILVALLISGVIVGQIVRRAYLIADSMQLPTNQEGT